MTTSNKCKNCGGELIFVVETQDLKCNHCSSLVEIESKNKTLEKKVFTPSSTISTSKTKYTQFSCATCGRKHITTSDTSLSRCPFCGDSTNLTKNVNIEYLPDGIIPFKVDKKNAISRLLVWIKKRKFAPNNLKHLARNESITGIYTPAYFYDFDCYTKYSGIGIKSYRSRNGEIRTTRQFFNSSRTDRYQDYIESAGNSISSDKLRSIGGYSKESILVYSMEYLYGWLGESVTDLIQTNVPKMKKTIEIKVAQDIRMSLPYDNIENFSASTIFSDIKYAYVYLPIWKGRYKYKSKEYSYYINGENGKVCGKAPKSFWKILGTTLLILGIVGTIIYIIAKYGG